MGDPIYCVKSMEVKIPDLKEILFILTQKKRLNKCDSAPNNWVMTQG